MLVANSSRRVLILCGPEEKAIAEFEQLAALKGLPAAKKSQGELDKEDDRSA